MKIKLTKEETEKKEREDPKFKCVVNIRCLEIELARLEKRDMPYLNDQKGIKKEMEIRERVKMMKMALADEKLKLNNMK